jgi:hypothetical protein
VLSPNRISQDYYGKFQSFGLMNSDERNPPTRKGVFRIFVF